VVDEADNLVVRQDLTVMEQLYNASRTNDTVKHVKVTRSMSLGYKLSLKLTIRCFSYNCEANGKCGRSFDEPVQAPAYAYALIAVGIVLCESAA